MVYFVAVWNILCSFGIFLAVLVSCAKKNLATLDESHVRIQNMKKTSAGVKRRNPNFAPF
jgi:hypothetical protein